MLRLSISERTRIVTLYFKHNLHFKRARYHVLRKFALEEDIISSERTIRKTIKHWLSTGFRFLVKYQTKSSTFLFLLMKTTNHAWIDK